MFKPTLTIGWDIGGAHLKAVLLDVTDTEFCCVQLPCPLWRGLQFLEQAIIETIDLMLAKLAPQTNTNGPDKALFSRGLLSKKLLSNANHAITMTGELVDLFDNRHQGVCEIAEVASKLLGKNVYFYTTETDNKQSGFASICDVPRFASAIASANWHASASFLAQHCTNALLIDIGSTTTDIIPIVNGKVTLQGNSDVARLSNDSLVYTGVVRTPIMALAQKLPFFDGDKVIEINVMAELFATTGDVYRLTGELDSAVDLADTADGKGKSPRESARRLARMIGYDVDVSLERWITLAFACKNLQMQHIKAAITRHLQPNMVIISAGAGAFLAQQMAADCHLPYQSIASLLKLKDGAQIEACLPAFAVAKLLQEDYTSRRVHIDCKIIAR